MGIVFIKSTFHYTKRELKYENVLRIIAFETQFPPFEANYALSKAIGTVEFVFHCSE